MTPQEQQMIDGLVGRIRGTRLTDRDPAVADRLQQGLGDFPDALYILAQTVLVQQNALEQAHAQLEAHEAAAPAPQQTWQPVAAQPPQENPGWLARFFGPPAAAPPPNPNPQYAQPYPPQPYPPSPYAPYAQPGMMGGGGGSFLRSAAQTAAGVVAGEMLFTGIESMFGGRSGLGGGGFGGGNTIINEYGDRSSAEHHAADTGTADGSFYNPSHDASRDPAAGSHDFAGTTAQQSTLADDTTNFTDDSTDPLDDTSSDDTGSDDTGSDDFSADDSSDFGGGDDSSS